jgi:protoporphyrinogen oxidase
MAAAYQLADHFHVTLYEGERRLGGHARTVVAGKYGDQPVEAAAMPEIPPPTMAMRCRREVGISKDM